MTAVKVGTLVNQARGAIRVRQFLFLVALSSSVILSQGCRKSPDERAPVAPVQDRPNYQLGTVVHFNAGGGSETYRRSGRQVPEAQFTWTDGNSATMEFILPSRKSPLRLYIRLAGLIKPPELPSQPVEVYANDTKIADWKVENTADFDATIPAKVLRRDGKVTIVLKLPKAVSPKSLGVSQDPRVLGVSCFQVQISKEKTDSD